MINIMKTIVAASFLGLTACAPEQESLASGSTNEALLQCSLMLSAQDQVILDLKKQLDAKPKEIYRSHHHGHRRADSVETTCEDQSTVINDLQAQILTLTEQLAQCQDSEESDCDEPGDQGNGHEDPQPDHGNDTDHGHAS